MLKHEDMDLVTVEDECAPDAVEYFDREVKGITGQDLNDFKNNYTEKRQTQIEVQYIIFPYVLIYYGDDPFHRLYKIK